MLQRILPFSAVLATLAALAAAIPSNADNLETITVTGSVSYLQRIALLPGSTATVAVSDVSLADAPAQVLADTSISANQIPIPFSLEVPTENMKETGRYALRATIHDANGSLRWTTDTHIPIDPDKALNDVGVLTLVQVTGSPATTDATYLCDNRTVTARYSAETLVLTFDGETRNLVQTRSGSGVRYETKDGSLVFWDRGIKALLQAGETESECTLQSKSTIDLTGGTWRVEDISARGVVDNSQTSLQFSADGQVSGRGGCNQYTGSYTRAGNTLTFGPLAVTQMACVPALGDQEKKFFSVLSTPVTISFDATGALVLTNEKGETLLARR